MHGTLSNKTGLLLIFATSRKRKTVTMLVLKCMKNTQSNFQCNLIQESFCRRQSENPKIWNLSGFIYIYIHCIYLYTFLSLIRSCTSSINCKVIDQKYRNENNYIKLPTSLGTASRDSAAASQTAWTVSRRTLSSGSWNLSWSLADKCRENIYSTYEVQCAIHNIHVHDNWCNVLGMMVMNKDNHLT